MTFEAYTLIEYTCNFNTKSYFMFYGMFINKIRVKPPFTTF